MENNLIPELRFPEFEGEWVEKRLSELLIFKNGINASKEDYGSGYKFINVLDIINNDFINHDKIIGSVNVSEIEFKKNIVEYGDILFQRSSETREEVGQANVYLDKEVPSTFGGFVIRGKKKTDYNPIFLNYLLKTVSARKEITSKSGGSTRYNVGQETLSSVSIKTTLIPEQTKIANFLTAVDKRINLLQKKKAELEQYKKGVMQKMFSQTIRFKQDDGSDFPDWEVKTLGEVCEKMQSGGTPKSTNKEYYNGDIPFLSINDMTTQGKYLHYTTKTISQEGLKNSSSWLVPKNSLIYSMYASVGFVSINKIQIATSQAVINMILKKDIDLEYLYYYLLFFKERIGKYIETGTQGNINAQIVKSFIIPMPKKEEQQKIANFLSSIDKSIEKLGNQIDDLVVFKQGLLQKMFV